MRALTLLDIAILVAYAVASALYLAYHVGLRDRVARAARWTTMFAFGLQLLDIGERCFRMLHPLSSTPEAVAFVAWLVAGSFLALGLRYRLAAAGAFAVPAVLVLLVLARVLPDAPGIEPMGGLGVAHVALATVGMAAFAFAAILAVLYLVQERHLKRKEFQRVGGAAAPLETLDRLATRCVSLGFPVFTLAILTGAVLVARLGLLRDSGGVRVEYLFAVVSWIAFGVLLVARAAAWLTVAGFTGALFVLGGYFLRHLV